jgi:hypothetical protein
LQCKAREGLLHVVLGCNDWNGDKLLQKISLDNLISLKGAHPSMRILAHGFFTIAKEI